VATSLRQEVPLSWRKILKKCIGGTLINLVVLGIISVFVLAFGFGALHGEFGEDMQPRVRLFVVAMMALWFFFVGVKLLWTPFFHWLYFRWYFYDADGQNIVIRKGVVSKREITLPFSKITDVYVDQDVMDAFLGLYDVHISTPTESSGRLAHIDGVTREGSEKLKALILQRIHAAGGR